MTNYDGNDSNDTVPPRPNLATLVSASGFEWEELVLTSASDWGQNTGGGKMPDVPPLKLPKSAKKPAFARKPRLY